MAKTLDLETVLQQAITNSFELKMAQKDREISHTDIKSAQSEYFPILRASANTEYQKDLQKLITPVTSVGNTFLPSGTRYQNSIGFNLNQTLLDFGVRKRKVGIAQKGEQIKSTVYQQTQRDLKLKLIDVYSNALIQYKTLQANTHLLSLTEQEYKMKQRLQKAGLASQVDVADEALQLAQLKDAVSSAQEQLQQQLLTLSYYTQELYDPKNIDLADLEVEPQGPLPILNESLSPDVKTVELQIQQKRQEIELLKRQHLPQVSLYSNYNFYGLDPEAWSSSLRNITQRNMSIGLAFSVSLFDGLKSKATIEKARLESEKLIIQKAETAARLRHQARVYQQTIQTHQVQLSAKAEIVSQSQDKLQMINRLSEQRLISKTQMLKEQMGQIKHQLELEKAMVEETSTIKKLQVLSAG